MTSGGAPELLRPVAADVRQTTEIGRFLSWLERERGLAFDGYDGLHRWSVDDQEGFWSSIAEFFEVRFATPPERVLGRRDMPGAEWFPGATVNYAQHAVGLPDDADQVAVFAYSQTRERRERSRGGRRGHGGPAPAGRRGRRGGGGGRGGGGPPPTPPAHGA